MPASPRSFLRRGRGVLDSRNPLSVTLPLGHELWREADVVLAVGTRLFTPLIEWGTDAEFAIIRLDSDPEAPEQFAPPALSLIGDAACMLRALVRALAGRGPGLSRRGEMEERQARMRRRLSKLAPQALFLTPSAPSFRRKAFLSMRSLKSALLPGSCSPSISRARFSRRAIRMTWAGGLQPRSAPNTAGPTCQCSRFGGRRFSLHLQRACHRHAPQDCAHRCGFQRWHLWQRAADPGGPIRQSADHDDLSNPDFVLYAQSFGAHAERARDAQELRIALRRAFKRRDVPTLIEVPVGPMPSPWEFIHMARVRGR